MLLHAEKPHAIILSNVMKCILERASQQFEKKLAEGIKDDLVAITVTHHGYFFRDVAKDASWDLGLYITYLYMLWDSRDCSLIMA